MFEPRELVATLYRVFGSYTAGGGYFCGLCYSAEEVDYYKRTPVAAIDREPGRRLLWDAEDHWESADVYRHYLPRLLELLGPPCQVHEIYPGHLAETLIAMGFRWWPVEERQAVIDYLEALRPEFVRQESRTDWENGLSALRRPTPRLPPHAS